MTILIKRDDCETRLKNQMRHLMGMVALFISVFFVSCSSEDIVPETETDTYINLLVSAPTGKVSQNKTLEDNQVEANPSEEEKIYSIRVWAYPTGTTNSAPIGYTEKTGLSASGSTQVGMKILRRYAQTSNIDLYILLNAESLGKLSGTNNNTLTRSELEAANIDGTLFGINADQKTTNTEVPTTGLPISRVVTNISTNSYVKETEAEASANPIKINLVRAVSKLHFYFSRKANAYTDNVEVTRIEIDGNVLPTESPVFPDASQYDANEKTNLDIHSTNYTNAQYDSQTLKLDGVQTNDIKEVADPTVYSKSSNETAQAYMDRLNNALTGKNLSYLRETNKAITGKIYYRLADGADEKEETFTIPASGAAYRNNELVVYGYFMEGGKLCLDTQVLPWTVTTSQIGWTANCTIFAYPNTGTASAQGGDAEGLYCMVSYPRYKDDAHTTLTPKSSGAAYQVTVNGTEGLVWKAHLTNTEDFQFNYEATKNGNSCVSTGISRSAAYQLKVEAKNAWTNGTDFNNLTTWAQEKENSKKAVYTDLYITVSLDGIHEYELEINPDNAGGMYKNGRKFAGTNTRIRIYQVKATYATSYDDLQKNSGLYKNYLNN